MRKFIPTILCLLCLLLSACDHEKQAREDFHVRANMFWKNAIANNCEQIEQMVRYPILMDNKSIDNFEEFNSRCNALSTSARYHKEKKGITTAEEPLSIYESGWLKKGVLEGHPLLKSHVGNDTSFFLLEVTSPYFRGEPASFIFRRDYEDSNGDWNIIMFEPYSLTKIMKNK